MAESTLAVTFGVLKARVGDYFGYGRGADVYGEPAWTTQQETTIKEMVESGLRLFYDPAPIDGVKYSWSFLRPATTLTLTEGDPFATLPDGFGGFDGDLTVTQDDTSLLTWRVRVTGEGEVRSAHAADVSSSGRPLIACEYRGDETSSEYGQRFRLYVFPTPDRAYTVGFAYRLLVDGLTDLLPYHYGGAAHAETVVAACMAAAELYRDNIPPGQGPMWLYYLNRLSASIATDKRRNPGHLGYNGDRSDLAFDRRQANWGRRVTYNGVQY